MNKKTFTVIIAIALCLSCSLSGLAADSITVLFTNDIHGNIDKDITYSKLAALAAEPDTLLIDAGDHLQGTVYASMGNGLDMVELMNKAGYDIATLGNHEFDYGLKVTELAIEAAEFPYVSCNFYYQKDGQRGELVLEAYKILEAGNKKIAFIGITTPETFISTAPVYFQDENGNFIYDIAGGKDGSDLYTAVQTAIDAAAKEADYIIAIGHLGIENSAGAWTSKAVIANTTGLNAFIDGHSHSELNEMATDKAGNQVLLVQSGNYFDYVGKMTITANGKFTAELLNAESLTAITANTEIAAQEQAWIIEVDNMLGEKIAASGIDFIIRNEAGIREVRTRSHHLAELNADAYYWYVNDYAELQADIAIVNGGGVRADALAGDWTYNTCKSINPFGNDLCIVRISGQALLDALEFSARTLHEEENGGLLHTAGLKYSVNTDIPNTVKTDENGIWQGAPMSYRVNNIRIFDRESGSYQPIELNKYYTVAGSNFTLLNCGDGYNMFADAEQVHDYIVQDYQAFAAYIKAFRDSDNDSYANISSDNSPLAAFVNYEIDYENILGAERISTYLYPGTVHITQKGDCLWSIAEKYYGNGQLWYEIYTANGFSIKDPDLIYIDQPIFLPKIS